MSQPADSGWLARAGIVPSASRRAGRFRYRAPFLSVLMCASVVMAAVFAAPVVPAQAGQRQSIEPLAVVGTPGATSPLPLFAPPSPSPSSRSVEPPTVSADAAAAPPVATARPTEA